MTQGVSNLATTTKQDTIIGHVDGIEGLLTTIDADTGGILTAVQLIDNAISGNEMQVDIVASLPTGSNTIGAISNTTFSATQSGTWNITNVSGTVSLPTGAATSANQTTQTTALQLLDDVVVADNAGFTDGTTKVSMAGFVFDETAGTALTENDAGAARIDAKRAQIGTLEDGTTRGRYATVTASNALKTDGSAVTQPVSGTFWQTTQPVSLASTTITGSVAVTGPLTDTQLRATAVPVSLTSTTVTGSVAVTDNSGSLTVDAPVATPVFVRLSSGSAAVDTLPVSLTSVPSHAVTNAGTFATQITSIAAGDNNIGNVDVVSLPAITGTVELGATSLAALENITVVSSGTVTATLAAETTKVIGTVNQGTSPWVVSGTITATGPLTDTQLRASAVPVSLASVPSHAVTNAGTFAVQAAQSGTWNIGSITTLPSLPAGTNNIGDVDVLSLPTLANVTTVGTVTTITTANLAADDVHDGVAGTTVVMNGGYASSIAPTAVVNGDAARLWTTLNGALNIADGGSTISIDDGAGSITVDGTFWQATQPVSLASVPTHGVTNAGTFAVQVTSAPTTTVTGTFWQATQPVSLTSVPSHAVTNAGTFAVQVSSAIPAGTNNIGDVDILSIVPGTAATNLGKAVDNAAGATDTGALVLVVRDDALSTLTPVDNDYTQLRVDSTGRLWGSVKIDTALPTGSATIGAVNIAAAQTLATVTTVSTVTSLSQLAGQAINLGAGTTATGTLRVIEATAATGTQSNPSLSTTSATLLASSTSRRGATIYNGSTSIVYVRLSSTAASSTVFTIKLYPEDYYEVPGNYNGDITAILNTGSTTLVQVTQVT